MNEVIQSIIAIGGFGFLNYQIVIRVKDIDWGDEQDKKYWIILLSSLDYSFYLFWYWLTANLLPSIFLTLLTAVITSIIIPTFVEWSYKKLNKSRNSSGLSELEYKTMYDIFATDTDKQNCFVFDLRTGELLSSGYIAHTNGKRDDMSLILWPYVPVNDLEKSMIETEDELMTYLNGIEDEAKIYLNFEKNTKIIYF